MVSIVYTGHRTIVKNCEQNFPSLPWLLLPKEWWFMSITWLIIDYSLVCTKLVLLFTANCNLLWLFRTCSFPVINFGLHSFPFPPFFNSTFGSVRQILPFYFFINHLHGQHHQWTNAGAGQHKVDQHHLTWAQGHLFSPPHWTLWSCPPKGWSASFWRDYSALTYGSNKIKNEKSSSGIIGVASHGKHARATEPAKKFGNKIFR